MLASVYSYRVMVKSVSSCCVRGRWFLSNPVTINDMISSVDDNGNSKQIYIGMCICYVCMHTYIAMCTHMG